MKKYKSIFENKEIKLKDIYTAQSFIDNNIVKEKRNEKDYDIFITPIQDDDEIIYMLTDGNHSLQAALLDKVKPNIIIEKPESVYKKSDGLERYVSSFNDLSNPINVITKKELW